MAAKLAAFYAAGVYRQGFLYRGVPSLLAVLRGLVFAEAAAVGVAALAAGSAQLPPVAWLLDFYLAATLAVGARVSYRLLESVARVAEHEGGWPVILYGGGPTARVFLAEARHGGSRPYVAVGYVAPCEARNPGKPPLAWLGPPERLDEILRTSGAKEVILVDPHIPAAALEAARLICASHGVALRRFRTSFEAVEAGQPAHSPPAGRWRERPRRGADRRMTAAERVLLQLLSGRAEEGNAVPPEPLAAALRRHGLAPLLWHRLAAAGEVPRVDPTLARVLAREARIEMAREVARQRVARRALRALAAASVRAVVMKGSALAWWLYPAPHCRPRADTDLLVAPAHRARAQEALRGAGFSPAPGITGDLLMRQQAWLPADPADLGHTVDLHWSVLNAHPLAPALPAEELLRDAVPLAGPGEGAAALAPLHSLLLATLHAAAHHGGATRWIWLIDIHLLCGFLGPGGVVAAAGLAQRRGVASVFRAAVLQAHALCGADPPAAVVAMTPGRERSARYVLRGRRPAGDLLADLRALPGWAQRARLLRQHVLPPAAYMFARYGKRRAAWLPVLYLRRAAGGLRRALAAAPRD